jgi:hypothetical protein
LLRPCSHRSSVLGFTPRLNANTWRDMLSASRVSRTTLPSIGGPPGRAAHPQDARSAVAYERPRPDCGGRRLNPRCPEGARSCKD